MSSLSSSVVSLADSSSVRSNYTSTDPSPFSSGPATPTDDCSQPFHNVGVHNPSNSCGDGQVHCDVSTPKPQFLSKGFRQATKFAQGLITPKRKRIKSMSVSPSTPKLDSPSPIHVIKGPFAMNRGIDKAKRIFSLPNQQPRPILKPQPTLPSACASPALVYADGIIPGQNTPVLEDPVCAFGGQSMSADKPIASSLVPPAPNESFNIKSMLTFAAKVIFFLPWCIAVGATLSLAPQYSEFVAFQTGYVASLRGIHRFAHWAECGFQQIVVFFASVVIVGYFQMTVGVTLAALVVSRFIFIWQDFKFDPSIPLGEDDRQSLYRIAMMDNYGLDKDTVIYTQSENGETYRSVMVGEEVAMKSGECG